MPYIDDIKLIAQKLNDLLPNFVFLGGAIVGLLITDRSAPEPRATIDIDVITDSKSLNKFYELEKKLRVKGFKPDISSGIICRWKIDKVVVDIMPDDEEILGFSNSWYSDAIKNSMKYRLDDSTIIKLISPPYFIATKIEAFEGRGNNDLISSPDIEDILNLIDGREEIVDDIKQAPKKVQTYLAKKFRSFLKKDEFYESIQLGLPYGAEGQDRRAIIIDRIKVISEMASRPS